MLINIQDHLIQEEATIKEALIQLNKLPKTLTLFVVNKELQLIGTLTDGDIRRGFISGRTLEDRVIQFITSEYQYLDNGIDVRRVNKLKAKGIRLLPVLNNNKQIERVYDLNSLNSILPLDVVIMAGGRGKRLRPLTDSTPKSMLKIGGKPLLEYNIDRLITYGIENFYIAVNYLKEQIVDYFGDGSNKGIKIKYIEEEKPLGTAGALSLIDNFDNDILLTNSDLFTNINYTDLYLAFFEKKADLAVASIPYTVDIPYAILEEVECCITHFREKPSNTYFANAGIYILNKELVKQIPKNVFFDTTDLMQNVIDKKKIIIHNPIMGYWIDVGKHEDLKRAQDIVIHK